MGFTPPKRVVADSLVKHLNLTPPAVLYHYTSMDVLEKITRTKEVWASEVSHLNDRTEYSHALDFIKSVVEKRLEGNSELKKLVDTHVRAWKFGQDGEEAFVCSFSEQKDSLPQWRGYCSAGLGVAIGFSSRALRGGTLEMSDEDAGTLNPENLSLQFELLKCVYTQTDKTRLIEDAIGSYIKALRGESKHIGQQNCGIILRNLISMCRPLFKHRSFKEEHEWRLVVSTDSFTIPTRRFRVGRSSIIPYLQIGLNLQAGEYIKEIMVGPTPNEELAVKGVSRMLFDRGLGGVTVRASQVPYRMW
jgi:hypothetical protein